MTLTEIILYTVFVTAVLFFVFLGVIRGETQVPNKLHMTEQEVSHVMTDLKKRSAADCILTRTETGFQCKEMGSNKIFKVKSTGKE